MDSSPWTANIALILKTCFFFKPSEFVTYPWITNLGRCSKERKKCLSVLFECVYTLYTVVPSWMANPMLNVLISWMSRWESCSAFHLSPQCAPVNTRRARRHINFLYLLHSFLIIIQFLYVQQTEKCSLMTTWSGPSILQGYLRVTIMVWALPMSYLQTEGQIIGQI